jgi:hypothetical protein
MSDFIVPGPDGKPIFIGKEDPKNPPRAIKKCNHGSDECSHMICPVCGNYVDYLLGTVSQGCEACYDPKKDIPQEEEKEQKVEEVIPSGGD